MEKGDLKRAEQQVAAMDAAARQDQVNQVAAILHADAKAKVEEAIARLRVVNGKDADPDGVMIAASIVAYTHFLVGQGILPEGRDTDRLMSLAIQVIPGGAVAGKAESHEKRIITLG